MSSCKCQQVALLWGEAQLCLPLVCLGLEKKNNDLSDPMVTHNYLKMTYCYPRVTYSDPKVTYSDPTHLPLPPHVCTRSAY